jgi:hypothetical protein
MEMHSFRSGHLVPRRPSTAAELVYLVLYCAARASGCGLGFLLRVLVLPIGSLDKPSTPNQCALIAPTLESIAFHRRGDDRSGAAPMIAQGHPHPSKRLSEPI